MSITQSINIHWLVWLGSAAAAVLAWLGTNVVGQPVLKFWSDRTDALKTVQEHGLVSWQATQERVSVARTAIRLAAASLLVYEQGGPIAVRTYARIRNYDLGMAGRALNGLHDQIGEGGINEVQRNNRDAVFVCLGATSTLSRERITQIRQMILEAKDKNAPQ